MRAKWVALAAVLLILGGCSTTQPQGLTPQRCGAWLNQVPPDDAHYHYFVGLSKHFATLAGARDDALSKATEQFVKYTGMSVKTVDHYLAIFGGQEASKLLDPTISEAQKREIRAQAFVRRVKAKTWCDADEYEAAVLVSVPLDEQEHVQQWALGRRNDLLQTATQNDAAAREETATGNVVAALKNLQSARNRLDEADGYSVTAPLPAGTVNEAQVEQDEAQALNGLSIAVAGAAHLRVYAGDVPPPIVIRASVQPGAHSIPAVGLPLVVVDRSAGRWHGITNPQGEYVLNLDPFAKPLQQSLSIGVDTAPLDGQISPQALIDLQGPTAGFGVEVVGKRLEDYAQEVADRLAQGLTKTVTVVPGPFTYGDTGASGRFSAAFKADLITALAQNPRFHVKAEASVTAQVSHRGLSRGLDLVPADSPATLAVASEAQTVVFGSYAQEGDDVVIHASLKNQRNRLVTSDDVRVPKAAIPADLSLVPPDMHQTQVIKDTWDQGHQVGDFRLDLWIDRGNGAIYHAGDHLYVNIRAARDCYLRLVYFDAGGNKILIFPNAFQHDNRIRAGEVVQIPGNGATFDFTVQPPFGSEVLAAFASTRPFPPAQGQQIGNGMVLLSGDPEAIIANQRGVDVTKLPDTQRAEAKVTLTTMAKGK